MLTKRLSFVAALCCAALIPVTTAGAAEPAERRAEHCVMRIVGQRPDGELVTDNACFDTFPEAMASVGIRTDAKHPLEADLDDLARRSSGDEGDEEEEPEERIIAVHFDYFNLQGPSVSVIGTTCMGGYVNLPPTWTNRISSTASAVCSVVAHFDLPNKGGASEDTMPSGNLSALNNKADSIQYL